MRTLLCIFLLSTAVFANTCLSQASGNWNVAGTWTTCGGGVPGDGDTAKIAQGQTVTIPAGYHAVVGLSAAGNTQAASTLTTLSAAITTTSQTAITVTSGSGIVNGAYIIIQKESTNTNEIVQVSAGGGTASLTIVRAQLGTAASLHANAAAVYVGSIPAISCDGSTYYGANGTGVLAIADTGYLTFRGNVEQCNALWTVGKDAILEHDSSLAPGTPSYKWVIGSYLFPDSAVLQVRGTQGHRTTIRNATGSGTFFGFAQYFGGSQGTGQFDFAYVNITGCGGTTVCTNASNHNATTAYIARCDHCNLTSSGTLSSTISFPGGAVNVNKFTNVTATSTTNSSGTAIQSTFRTLASVVLDTIYTDGAISMGANGDNCPNVHFRNVVTRSLNYGQYALNFNGYAFHVGEFDRYLRITDESSGASTGTWADLPGGNITRTMCIIYGSYPHCFSGPYGDATDPSVIDGGYLEKYGGGTGGHGYLGSGPPGPATLTTVKNVVVACATDTGYGVSLSSNAIGPTYFKTFLLTNNTYCGKYTANDGTSRGFGFELAYTAPAGMLAGLRNNIVFSNTPADVAYIVHTGATGTPSAGTFANVDYNWKWNVGTGPYQYAPNAYYAPNPPGSHDSTGDPQFVQQRHFLDWCQMLQPSITSWTDCVAQFAKMNDDTGFDPRFTILNAYNWLRAGYVPRNAAVYTADDTGGQVGAMNLIPSKLAGPTKIAGPGVVK